MQTISTIEEIKNKLFKERSVGRSIGLVPTMGYFHHGHEALMKKARQGCDLSVVSIFVNPTQFSQGEDFSSYPRDMAKDSEIAQTNKVDYLFTPNVEEMYPASFATTIEVSRISDLLCGKSRPSHFKGVATVVAKLLNIIGPDKAYFGLKDYQQFRVIESMVGDLNMETEVVPVDTIRDDDGLAASSRNSYLRSEEREQALTIFKSLSLAKELFENGIDSAFEIIKSMTEMIDKRPLLHLEYIHVVNKMNLESIDKLKKENTLIAIAVKVGKARLIDNIEL